MNIIRSELPQTEQRGHDFEFRVANFQGLFIN